MKLVQVSGWVYEDGTVVPDDILDIIGWDSNGKMLSDDNINGNVNPVAVAIFQADAKGRPLSGLQP